MGNQESQGINAEGANGKLENGAANGHVTISPEDPNGTVASETAVQQNSEPPQPTNESSPPSEIGVADSKDKNKDPPPVTKSLGLFSFSKMASPSNDAPAEPPEPPVSDKVSAEEEVSQQSPEPASEPPEADSAPKEPEPNQKSEKKGKLFGKVFKKKNKGEKESTAVESDSPSEDQDQAAEPQTLTNGPNSEPGDVKGSATAGQASETLPGTPAGGESLEVDGKTANQVETEKPESPEEESPVMNFFKTFVSPRKVPKEEAPPAPVPVEEVKVSEEPEPAAPAEPSPAAQPAGSPTTEPKAPLPAVRLSVVAPFGKLFKTKALKSAKKDTKGTQEVDASGTAQASKPSPPPPPSEPPKLEVRVEPAAKPAAGAQKEADASKQPEGAGVQKPSKGSPFRKLFHSKTGDAKATDARATPDQSPKAEKKSNLISIFKPMVLQTLHVSSVPAGSSNVPASSATVSPDVKAKEGPSVVAPSVTIDAAQAALLKMEPKPAAEAEKKRIVAPEARPVGGKSSSGALQLGSADGTSSLHRKLQKRHSIHMFFKSLAPKRQCDAGVQTDPVTIIYPAK